MSLIEIVTLTPAEMAARRDEVLALEAAFATPLAREDQAGTEHATQAPRDHPPLPGFRCVAARAAGEGPLLGLAYGNHSLPGDWWREDVARALPPTAAERWLSDCFALACLAVAPAARRRGLGGRLHAAVLAGLPYRTAALALPETEMPALAFYRSLGWITLREDHRFAPDGLPWRMLGLRLSPPASPDPARAATPTPRIRPFVPDDQAPARQLILAGLGEHFGFVDEHRNPDVDDIAAHYLTPGHVVVVAEWEGTLIGTGALRIASAREGSLVRMSVAPAARRLGIGRALVLRLVGEARRRGLRRLMVETNRDWYDALGLYISCGFREYALDDESIYLEREVEGEVDGEGGGTDDDREP
ncbi:MAG: GNAT family N-acetyltransferase [Ktedonobacterales bacterium]|nr:GNAT family N-acetyltransferase [Ktedonobacterales bacterium]